MVEADCGRWIAKSPKRWQAQVHFLRAGAVGLRFDQELRTRYWSTFHILHFKIGFACGIKVLFLSHLVLVPLLLLFLFLRKERMEGMEGMETMEPI
jgi:hypothetical protein